MAWLLEPGVAATLIIGAGTLAFLTLLAGIVVAMRRR
ncbi:hypothetical protein JOF48_000513 [Arthrobacter stackebrandtii]|uniref:LPXTG cell wall anchor domain-containing protein n=1 Tax=Arthrobacter stackebrandtii TaxID=272161 RepID=A0ABS4YSE3_9MICC|nr:hypothetical protein [Arthrobacter stackebrandtii]